MHLLRNYLLANIARAPETETGSEPPPVIVNLPAGTDADMSVFKAARTLSAARRPKAAAEAAPAQAEPKPAEVSAPQERQQEAAPQAEESAEAAVAAEADAAAVETPPPDETAPADPAIEDLPPIAPPRSWTKADKDVFASLPRATQERLAERERSSDTDISRRQNEAADKLKGLAAKEQAVEQVRTQYESALPVLLERLQAAQANEFSDIKIVADVEKLSREDWPRYAQWDFAQKKIALVQQQMGEAMHRQQFESQQRFAAFANTEDALLIEKIPEMSDAKKAADIQTKAVAALKAIGFDETELGQAWNGQKALSLRDHRVQLLIRDASLWRDAQAKAKTVQAKPVPPVQRPGVTQPKGVAQAANVENLLKQVDTASGMGAVRAAAQALKARRAAR